MESQTDNASCLVAIATENYTQKDINVIYKDSSLNLVVIFI